MIIVLFGQPCSGKSTLANLIQKQLDNSQIIDGDVMRKIFSNTDYSKAGRISNLNRISDIATYMAYNGHNIIVSAVYPFKEARDYFNSISDNILWVYLHYDATELRGRESYHLKDFDFPKKSENVLRLNTTKRTEEECINKIEVRYKAII